MQTPSPPLSRELSPPRSPRIRLPLQHLPTTILTTRFTNRFTVFPSISITLLTTDTNINVSKKKLKHLYPIHVFKTDHEFNCNTQHHHQHGHCQCVWSHSSEEKSLQGRQLEIVTTTTSTPPVSTKKTLYKISEEKSKGGVTSSRSRDYEEEISVRPVLLFQPFLTSTNRFNYLSLPTTTTNNLQL